LKNINSLFLQKVCIIYNIVWAISPILAYGTIYRVLAVLASVSWLLLEIFRPNNIFVKPSRLTLLFLSFLLFQIGLKIIVPDQFGFVAYFQLYIFYLFGLMGESLRKRNYQGIEYMVLIVLLLMPIWMLTTNIALASMEGENGATVTRVLAKSSAEAEALTELGVGGYGMVYFLVLYIPSIFFLIRKRSEILFKSKILNKLFYPIILTNFLSGIYTIYKADYVIAILLMLVGLGFSFFYSPTNRVKKGLFLGGLVAGVVVIPMLIVRYINELSEIFWGTSLHRKLVDIQISVVSGKSSGTVLDRTERYMRSIGYYLDNPIFGTLKKDNLGKHSMVLDTFAQYGTLLGILFVFTLMYLFWRSKNEYTQPSNIHLTMAVLLFLTAALNNLGAILGVAVFIVYPGALKMANSKIRLK
jgi:hypothetical protein